MEEELRQKIEAEITKAKLSGAESRVNFLLAAIGIFAGIFGLIIPFLQTSRMEKLVEDAVNRTDKKIEELNSISNRKPDLVLYDNDAQLLSGSTIVLSCYSDKSLRLANKGDGKAEFVKFKVMQEGQAYFSSYTDNFWSNTENSDDERFQTMQTKYVDIIYPNDYLKIPLGLTCIEGDTIGEVKGRLEIFHSEPKELKFNFKIIKTKQ